MRDSSHAITRSTVHRGVTSIPHSLSAPSANATLLPIELRIADVRNAADDRLAIELEHQPQHAVRRGVLWTEVDEHVIRGQLRLDRERGRECQSAAVVTRNQGNALRAALRIEARSRELYLHGSLTRRHLLARSLARAQPLTHVFG